MTSKNWMLKDTSDLAQWQREISDLTTDSFCVLPWIHVSTRTNGDMRVCCVANSGGAGTDNSTRGVIKNSEGLPTNLGQVPLDQAWNQQYLRDIRTKMIEGQAPMSCERCYKEESQGMASKRVWETLTWHKKGTDLQSLIADTTDQGQVAFQNAKYLDLRLGNTCNLGCVMCSSHDSSYWLRDHEQTYHRFTDSRILDQRRFSAEKYQHRWWEQGEFWHSLAQQIPHLEHIAFAGGEPLLIKQHRTLLKKIIAMNRHHHIELRYITNGTVLDDEILDLWSYFDRVHVTVSMDALDQRLSYIRYPIDPEVLYKNLSELDRTDSNITVNLAVAVQILNIMHLPDFIKWKVQQHYKKINHSVNPYSGYEEGGGLMIPNLVWTPTWFNVQALTPELKAEVEAKFDEVKDWLRIHHSDSEEFWQQNPYGWSRWQGLLNWMLAQDRSDQLPAFRQYLAVMDQQRHSDWTKTFPELALLAK